MAKCPYCNYKGKKFYHVAYARTTDEIVCGRIVSEREILVCSKCNNIFMYESKGKSK